MSAYYITVIVVIIFTFSAEKADYASSLEPTYGLRIHSRTTKNLFVIAIISLIIVGGLRYGVGADYWAYYAKGEQYASSLVDSIKKLDEPGIRLIFAIIRKFTTRGIVPIFVFQVFTLGLMGRILFRYSDQLLMTTLLFIFLGCWHTSFNVVRQCLACAVLFCGFPYLRERRFWKFVLICFIAFLFHRSAIVMLALYPASKMRINSKNIILILGIIVFFSLSFDRIISITEFVLQDDFYKSEVYASTTVNIFRILVAIAPAAFYLFEYSNCNLDDNTSFYIMMTIINAVVMVISSQSALAARIGIYTAPFVAISIPELNKGINPSKRKIVNFGMCFLYGIYFFYEISSSAALNPYYSYLSTL